jgi:ATP-binding cassette subfamily B protein
LLKSVFKGGVLTNASGTLANATGSIGGIVIIWVGVTAVLNGDFTMGQLLTFNALLAYFLEPIQNLINLQPTMQSAIVASDR